MDFVDLIVHLILNYYTDCSIIFFGKCIEKQKEERDCPSAFCLQPEKDIVKTEDLNKYCFSK